MLNELGRKPEKRREERRSEGTLLVLRLKPKDVRRDSVEGLAAAGTSFPFPLLVSLVLGSGPDMLVGG